MERTNKLFTVTLCKYANMAVEADNPQQAMDIAKRYIKDHISDKDFEDSEIDVYGTDAYARGIDDMCLESGEKVFCQDGVITAGQYEKIVNEEDIPAPKPDRGETVVTIAPDGMEEW